MLTRDDKGLPFHQVCRFATTAGVRKGYVSSIRIIGLKSKALSDKAASGILSAASTKDLHAHLDSNITPLEMCAMNDVASKGEGFPNELIAAQTRCTLRATHAQPVRSDDLLSSEERFSVMFTKEFGGIGPNGTMGLGMLTNSGKTNAPHQLQYTGMIPHKNALFCPITAKGVVFVHRFMVLGEALPDLTAPDEFMRFPTLRAASAPHAPLVYRHCADHLQQLYSHCDVLCAKVTHQGRAQDQRDLDDGGVSRGAIARMAHYDHRKQAESYLFSLQCSRSPLQRGWLRLAASLSRRRCSVSRELTISRCATS